MKIEPILYHVGTAFFYWLVISGSGYAAHTWVTMSRKTRETSAELKRAKIYSCCSVALSAFVVSFLFASVVSERDAGNEKEWLRTVEYFFILFVPAMVGMSMGFDTWTRNGSRHRDTLETRSCFDGLGDYEKLQMADKVTRSFGEVRANCPVGVPMTALKHSREDIKLAFQILSTSARWPKEDREILRQGFALMADIASDEDIALSQLFMEVDHRELSEEQWDRHMVQTELRFIRYNILNYEWDEWMMDNGIEQERSFDDFRRTAGSPAVKESVRKQVFGIGAEGSVEG